MYKINKSFFLLPLSLIVLFALAYFHYKPSVEDNLVISSNTLEQTKPYVVDDHKGCSVSHTFEYGTDLDSSLTFLNDYEIAEAPDSRSQIVQIHLKEDDPNDVDFTSISIRCIDPSVEFFDGRDYLQYISESPLPSVDTIPLFDEDTTMSTKTVRKETYDKNGITEHYYLLNENGFVYHYVLSNKPFWINNEMLISLTK